MLPGVRPSISLALLPTASTLWVTLLIATIEGSETTIPRPRAKTSVFAVPRSIAKSLENKLKIERKFIETDLKTFWVFDLSPHNISWRTSPFQGAGKMSFVMTDDDLRTGGKPPRIFPHITKFLTKL